MKEANEQIAELINRTTKDELSIEADQNAAAQAENTLTALEQERAALAAAVNEKNIALTAARKDVAAFDYRIRETQAQAQAARGDITAKQADIDGLRQKMKDCGADW